MTAKFAYRKQRCHDWCSRSHVTLTLPTKPCVYQQTRIFRWRRCLKLFLLHGAPNNAAACAPLAPRYTRVCERAEGMALYRGGGKGCKLRHSRNGLCSKVATRRSYIKCRKRYFSVYARTAAGAHLVN